MHGLRTAGVRELGLLRARTRRLYGLGRLTREKHDRLMEKYDDLEEEFEDADMGEDDDVGEDDLEEA